MMKQQQSKTMSRSLRIICRAGTNFYQRNCPFENFPQAVLWITPMFSGNTERCCCFKYHFTEVWAAKNTILPASVEETVSSCLELRSWCCWNIEKSVNWRLWFAETLLLFRCIDWVIRRVDVAIFSDSFWSILLHIYIDFYYTCFMSVI